MTIHVLIPIADGLIAASDGAGAQEFDGPFFRLAKIRPVQPNMALLALGRYFAHGTNGTFNLLNEFGAIFDTSGIEAAADHCRELIQQFQLARNFNDNICTVIVLSAAGMQPIEFNYAGSDSPLVLQPEIPEPVPINASLMIGPRNFATPRWSELIPPNQLAYFTENATPIQNRSIDEGISVLRSVFPAARQISYRELREVPISDIFDACFLTATTIVSIADGELF